MHNNDSKTASISKSYTNSKKEELLKVINEAKQKLENVSKAVDELMILRFKILGHAWDEHTIWWSIISYRVCK